MKIPTANILVAFSRKTINRLFVQGGNVESLIKTLTKDGEDDAVLFNAESNPNFISFEHDFGFAPGHRMKLEFIDPKGVFERRYLNTSMVGNIAGYDHKQKKSKPDILSSKNNEDMKESSKEYSKAYYDDFNKEYMKEYGTKFIYVAYGSGDNLDLWSGPHKMVLNAADISVKGARKISLTLTPTPRPLDLGQRTGAYNEKVNLNLGGLTMRYAGESKLVNFKNLLEGSDKPPYDPLEHLDLHINAETTINNSRSENIQLLKTSGFPDLASNIGDFDVHSMITDAFRSYIQKATGTPNVIVLLPNINMICRKHIDEVAKNARLDWDSSKTTGPGAEAYSAVQTRYADSAEARAVAKKEEWIRLVLFDFGLTLGSMNPDTWRSPNNVTPMGALSKYTSVEKYEFALERFEADYTEKDYIAILQKSSNIGLPDHMEVIRGVINKINVAAAGEYVINLGCINETQTALLDYWGGDRSVAKPKVYPTFGGYHEFDADREAIIVGDLGLIQQYLYAKANLSDVQAAEQSARSALADVKSNQAEQASSDRADFLQSLRGGEQTTPFGAPTFDITQIRDDLATQQATEAAVGSGKAVEAATENIIRTIPLHPLDRAIVGMKGYNKAVKKIVFPPWTKNPLGSFGDITDLPDDFGYADFNEDKKKYIKEQGISIFRYNTSNPNVLDLKFKFGGVYFGALEMGFKKMVSRRASAVYAGVLPLGTGTLPIRTQGDAAAFLRVNNFSLDTGDEERAEILQELARRMSPELAAQMTSDPNKQANSIEALLDKAQLKDLQGYVQIDQMLPGNPNSTLAVMAEHMYRKALQMDITTLPSFHISSSAMINSPSIVFAQDAAITQSQEPSRTPLNSFFSGLYKVVGFRHTISSKEAKSEFKLVKNAVRNVPAPVVTPAQFEDFMGF